MSTQLKKNGTQLSAVVVLINKVNCDLLLRLIAIGSFDVSFHDVTISGWQFFLDSVVGRITLPLSQPTPRT
jgi:hypothetical protein